MVNLLYWVTVDAASRSAIFEILQSERKNILQNALGL